jgi:glycosyltransferase involved in cell wall biosynthesis
MVIGIDASRAFVNDKTGTETYSFHLINAILRLPEAKSHTFVLFIRPKAILPKELGGYSNVIVKEIQWKYLWTQIGLAWVTWGEFSNHKFSNSQIEVLWVPAHTLPILRRPSIKTVVTIHGLEYQWLPEYKNLLQRWYLPLSTIYAAKHADKLVAVSKFTKNQLVEATQIDKNNIKVIHEGVGRDNRSLIVDRRQVCDQYGLHDKKYILFVGTVQPRKNLPALIQAFALFSQRNPGYQLVIAGGIGWMAEEVLQTPAKYGMQERVVFTGRVTDLALSALYQGAQIYVQPSLTEGFGLPVLEAMVKGVPVISSDGGALCEVVGNAGLIVPLGNRKEELGISFGKHLAGAMEAVVRDKKLYRKLVSMGLDRVKQFGWDRAAKATLQVLVG